MSATDFFDSNVLLYLVSEEPGKADLAERLLAEGGTISVQVLDEFASVASRKFRKPMRDIRTVLNAIRSFCIVKAAGIETHELGLDIAERYKYSVYDSMLVAAALKAGCTTFYSEDLHNGQKIGGLMVRNPFNP